MPRFGRIWRRLELEIIEDPRLTDADGRELVARIVEIIGRAALVEYRPYFKGDDK